MASNRDVGWGALVVVAGVGGFLLGQERPFSPSPEEIAAQYSDIQQRIREALAEDSTAQVTAESKATAAPLSSTSSRQEKDPAEMTDAELDQAIRETEARIAGLTGEEPRPTAGGIKVAEINWKVDAVGDTYYNRFLIKLQNEGSRSYESVFLNAETYDSDDKLVEVVTCLVDNLPAKGEATDSCQGRQHRKNEKTVRVRVSSIH